jgi:hypothetical protein
VQSQKFAAGIIRDLPDEVFSINCGSAGLGIRMVLHRTCHLGNWDYRPRLQ